MCRYKTYHQSDCGYVIKCDGCDHLQLAFGTTVITFTHEQFDRFTATINEYHSAYADECSRHQKTIRIPTLEQSISLAFSVNELEKLLQMLEEAQVLIQADQLLTC